MSAKPTYEQAQLHLQVYDQRREAKLRQARDWFFKNYHVTSLDDVMRVAPMGSGNGRVRQHGPQLLGTSLCSPQL